MASFVTTPLKSEIEKKEIQKGIIKKFSRTKIQAFVEVSYAEEIYLSMNQMIESYGLGPLKPNTIICGIHKKGRLRKFRCVINKAYQRNCNMVILNSQNDCLESKLVQGETFIFGGILITKKMGI